MTIANIRAGLKALGLSKRRANDTRIQTALRRLIARHTPTAAEMEALQLALRRETTRRKSAERNLDRLRDEIEDILASASYRSRKAIVRSIERLYDGSSNSGGTC